MIPLDKVYHFVAGALKEALDEYRYQGADFFDFFATLAGTFAGVVIFEFIGG